MREIIVKLYKFEELDDKAKSKARDWFVGCLDSTDYDTTECDILERAKTLGFECALRWSGFGNQGDGACLVGWWKAADLKVGATQQECPQDTKLHEIAEGLEKIKAAFPCSRGAISHHGHYSHENSNIIAFELDRDAETVDEAAEMEQTKEFKDLARSLMRWAYKQLDAQNDWLHSEEYVDEALIANEYEFTEDGAIH